MQKARDAGASVRSGPRALSDSARAGARTTSGSVLASWLAAAQAVGQLGCGLRRWLRLDRRIPPALAVLGPVIIDELVERRRAKRWQNDGQM